MRAIVLLALLIMLLVSADVSGRCWGRASRSRRASVRVVRMPVDRCPKVRCTYRGQCKNAACYSGGCCEAILPAVIPDVMPAETVVASAPVVTRTRTRTLGVLSVPVRAQQCPNGRCNKP